MKIPKILHVMWIGPKKAPYNLIITWKKKNPDFEIIFWNEFEIEDRELRLGFTFKCIKQINDIREINGKCDIMRWEILYKYGGIFVDADSFCIEPIDDYFLDKSAFSTFENENVRKSLVACGMMGFVPNHPLCRDIIEWIADPLLSETIINERPAWVSVGPVRLTEFLETGNYPDFSVFPSYCVLPIHHTGLVYEGHNKVYAHQFWGTSNNSYDTLPYYLEIPKELEEPELWFSVLISSYNTKREYIKDCLDSIKNQNGHFGIELVWVNDGSDNDRTEFLEEELYNFGKSSRFIKIKYVKILINCYPECLNIGIRACSNEFIFRMDSDDIMLPNRLRTQYTFMIDNPDAVVCGCGMRMFDVDGLQKDIIHRNITTWDEFVKHERPPEWILNNPTTCYKKSALLSVNCYDSKYPLAEDYDLQLRLMKKYGAIYNINDIVIYYRIHKDQITNSDKFLNRDTDLQYKIFKALCPSEEKCLETKIVEIDL